MTTAQVSVTAGHPLESSGTWDFSLMAQNDSSKMEMTI